MSSKRGRPRHDDLLTPGEWRVANFVRHGMTNKSIALQLGISPDAVKFHVANILAKLDLKDRKHLQKWSGAPRGTNLKTEMVMDEGNAELNEPATGLGRIGQLARNVKDLDKAEAFYRDVLGLTHLFRAGPMSFFQVGEVRLMLQQMQMPLDSYIIYFAVADIKAEIERLEAKGVNLVSAPHMIHRHEDGTEEWMAFIDDCDGNKLGLMSRTTATTA